jgi:hypothetical protein
VDERGRGGSRLLKCEFHRTFAPGGPAPRLGLLEYWLDSLSDIDFKRVDEVCGMLAEKGSELGGPWPDNLEGPVWELRIRLRDVAARITYWCTAEGTIVLLTVFRKTRQHDQRQIDRAVRAQKTCERAADVHLTAGHDLGSVWFEPHAA